MSHDVALCRVDELKIEPWTAVFMTSRRHGFEAAKV